MTNYFLEKNNERRKLEEIKGLKLVIQHEKFLKNKKYAYLTVVTVIFFENVLHNSDFLQ